MKRFGGSKGGFGNHGRNFNRSSEHRKMYKAICSDCKQECEVPFEPTEGKSVYCKDCFRNHRKF